MRRHLLGIIAVAALALAATIAFYPPFAEYKAAGGVGLRVGSVLAVFWLAWPDLYRLPQWAWYVLPFAILALIYARSILLYLSPVLAVAITGYVLYRKIWRVPR